MQVIPVGAGPVNPCVCPKLGSHPLSCYVTAEGAHSDPPVAVQLIYVMLSSLLRWMVRRAPP